MAAAQSKQQTHDDHHDDEDVKTALGKNDTADGSGFESEDDLPESDFGGDADEYEGPVGLDVSGLESEVMADLEDQK